MDNGAQYYYLKMQALLRFSKKKHTLFALFTGYSLLWVDSNHNFRFSHQKL